MKMEKVRKLVANLLDKQENVVNIQKFKTSTKSWISIKKKCIGSLNSNKKL